MTATEKVLLKWEKKYSEAKGAYDAMTKGLNSFEGKIAKDIIEIVESFIEDLKTLSENK